MNNQLKPYALLLWGCVLTVCGSCSDGDGWSEIDSSDSWSQSATIDIDVILSDPIARLCDMRIISLDASGKEIEHSSMAKEYHFSTSAEIPPRQSYLLQDARVYLVPKQDYLTTLDAFTSAEMENFVSGMYVKTDFYSVYPNGSSAGKSTEVERVPNSGWTWTSSKIQEFVTVHQSVPLLHVITTHTNGNWNTTATFNLSSSNQD